MNLFGFFAAEKRHRNRPFLSYRSKLDKNLSFRPVLAIYLHVEEKVSFDLISGSSATGGVAFFVNFLGFGFFSLVLVSGVAFSLSRALDLVGILSL